VIPSKFEYLRAQSVDGVLGLLKQHGDDAKILAGGHSLIPAMKLRLTDHSVLVDIGRLPNMDGISVGGGRVTIGALATHAALARSADLREHGPALWDAANHLGDPQVRNRGTIGGACAHSDPAADYPAVLLALDATLELVGPSGKRSVKADDFFVGMFETALRSDELLTAISFADAPKSAYAKYRHPASHYAVVGVAARLEMKGDTIGSVRIAVAGVGDAAFRATGVEGALVGVKPTDEKALEAACAGAASGVDARADVFASGEYRVAMADVYAARAVRHAAMGK
jgi:aerobic carbon-monoxide dehydrogenase medium subunit